MNNTKFLEKIYFCLFVLIFIISYPLYLKAKDQILAANENDTFDLPGRIYYNNY